MAICRSPVMKGQVQNQMEKDLSAYSHRHAGQRPHFQFVRMRVQLYACDPGLQLRTKPGILGIFCSHIHTPILKMKNKGSCKTRL